MTEKLTAEEYADQRYDLPDGGRWHELDCGQLFALQPPDEGHGTTVLNLTRALGTWLHEHAHENAGYACFDLGLIVARCPDTVISPAISYFAGGSRFAEADKTITNECPQLVVEIASTNDRRQRMRERVRDYLALGVEVIWVVETARREVSILQRTEATLLLGEHHTLKGNPVLNGFSIPVREIFREPDWW